MTRNFDHEYFPTDDPKTNAGCDRSAALSRHVWDDAIAKCKSESSTKDPAGAGRSAEPSSSIGQWFSGIGRVASAIGQGVVDDVTSAAQGVKSAAGAVVDLAEHPGRIVSAVEDAAATVGHELAKGPAQVLSDAESVAGSAVNMVASGAEQAVEWVANHKLEAAVIAGVAITSATPLVAVLAAAGGAASMHALIDSGEKLVADKDQLDVLMHPEGHSPEEIAQAKQAIGQDAKVGVEALGMVGIVGVAGKAVGMLRSGTQAAKAGEAVSQAAARVPKGPVSPIEDAWEKIWSSSEGPKSESKIVADKKPATGPATDIQERLTLMKGRDPSEPRAHGGGPVFGSNEFNENWRRYHQKVAQTAKASESGHSKSG